MNKYLKFARGMAFLPRNDQTLELAESIIRDAAERVDKLQADLLAAREALEGLLQDADPMFASTLLGCKALAQLRGED